jgi:hypothetical protein
MKISIFDTGPRNADKLEAAARSLHRSFSMRVPLIRLSSISKLSITSMSRVNASQKMIIRTPVTLPFVCVSSLSMK